MAKKAVVVGINRYGGGNDLPSCVTDAEQFAKYLRETRGFSDIRSLHDEEAGKQR